MKIRKLWEFGDLQASVPKLSQVLQSLEDH